MSNIEASETEIIRVEQAEIPELSTVASKVVKEHYDPLIGATQNDYMIEKFQSETALSKQFEDGWRYFWVRQDHDAAGFFAIYPRDGGMYISKFYLQKQFRGRHLARKMLEFIQEMAKQEGLSHVFLNVNRGNTDTIHIYQHLGFVKVREEDIDIGGGYYMNDYVMEIRV